MSRTQKRKVTKRYEHQEKISHRALAVRQETLGTHVLMAPKANKDSQAGLEGRSHVLFTFVSSVTSKILVALKHPKAAA